MYSHDHRATNVPKTDMDKIKMMGMNGMGDGFIELKEKDTYRKL